VKSAHEGGAKGEEEGGGRSQSADCADLHPASDPVKRLISCVRGGGGGRKKRGRGKKKKSKSIDDENCASYVNPLDSLFLQGKRGKTTEQ